MNEEEKRIDDLIYRVASFLAKQRPLSMVGYDDPIEPFTIFGHKFKVYEHEIPNITAMRVYRRISIVPAELNIGIEPVYVMIDLEGMSRNAQQHERGKACIALATRFVKNELPKINISIRKDVYNAEIEEILEVLE